MRLMKAVALLDRDHDWAPPKGRAAPGPPLAFGSLKDCLGREA